MNIPSFPTSGPVFFAPESALQPSRAWPGKMATSKSPKSMEVYSWGEMSVNGDIYIYMIYLYYLYINVFIAGEKSGDIFTMCDSERVRQILFSS